MIPQPVPSAPASEPTQLPQKASWLQFLARSRYLSLSLILHTVLLVILATVIIQSASEEEKDFQGDGNGLMSPASDLPDSAEQPAEAVPAEPQMQQQEVSASVPTTEAISTLAQNNTFVVPKTVTNLKGITDGVASNLAGSGTGGAGGLGGGMGTGGGGGGRGLRIFKAPVNAESVVLVLDVSSSMIGAPKSEKTYDVLEKEAANVIRGLKVGNKFGVVVFSQDARVYQEKMVNAHSDEKQRAINWLKKMSPVVTRDPRAEDDEKNFHHGTRADLGLKAAFDMKPDVIFFVSDGEPTGARVPDILDQVKASQKQLPKFVTVHSIAYLADGGQAFMKDLAGQNNGTFSEVNPRDLK